MTNIKSIEVKFEDFLKTNKNIIKNKNIGIAISGGPDSIALTLLLNKFKNKYSYKLIAFTVDHQLRKESNQEAKNVKNLMEKFSIKHITLEWQNSKPNTKILELARIARYNLLAESSNINKINVMMLGHHLDDQIETFIIRLEANSGLNGLACMSELSKIKTDFGNLNILRPLLPFKKQDLINICKEKQMKWNEDPTNYNLKYKRVRVRKILLNSNLHKDFKPVIDVYNKLKSNFDNILIYIIKNHIIFNKIGICQIDEKKFQKLPNLIKEKILIILIKIIGGKKYPRKTSNIKHLINKLSKKEKIYATLGGVYIVKNKNKITLLRQFDSTVKNIPIKSKKIIWDRRFIVENFSEISNLYIGPLTEKDYLNMIKLKKIIRPKLPFYAIKTIPTVRVLDEIVSIPHLLYNKNKFWKNNIILTHVENNLLDSCKKLYI